MGTKITIPAVVSTPSTDARVARGDSYDEIVAWARDVEARYIKLKLEHDNCLQAGYAPYLPLVEGIGEDELDRMLYDAGWTVGLVTAERLTLTPEEEARGGLTDEEFEQRTGFSREEWQMWRNRFRRLLAVAKAIGAI